MTTRRKDTAFETEREDAVRAEVANENECMKMRLKVKDTGIGIAVDKSSHMQTKTTKMITASMSGCRTQVAEKRRRTEIPQGKEVANCKWPPKERNKRVPANSKRVNQKIRVGRSEVEPRVGWNEVKLRMRRSEVVEEKPQAEKQLGR